MLLNNISVSLLVNVALIIAAILIVLYTKKIEMQNEIEKQKEENIENYNDLFEALIESNTQPTLIVDRKCRIKSHNSSVVSELSSIKNNEYVPKEYSFIYDFIEEDNIHSQTEIKLHNNHFLVSMSKFKSSVLDGAFITFTNISYIKEAQEIQNAFVQNASHELKTPISAIQGICELLLDDKVNDKQKMMDFISLISKENERLKSIISSLTITSGTQPVYHRFYIHDLFKEIELFFENYHNDSSSNSSKITFKTKNFIDIEVKQDEKIITQILINLIENAFKYTDTGSIILKAWMENDAICFSVKDTGIGINREDVNSIFKRFYRVEKSRSRKTGGSGLGLSIVKELLETLGGSIDVYSKVDKGTEFTISFKNIE